MTPGSDLEAEWGKFFAALSDAYTSRDREAFLAAVDRLVETRAQTLFRNLRDLSGGLRSALDQFQLNSRLAALAGKDVPDARTRLDHALKLTEDGAHRTLDLVERACPLADNIAKRAAALIMTLRSMRDVMTRTTAFPEVLGRLDEFLVLAQRDSEVVRGNLTDVLMAQSSQDLSGQIIRGVITLVGEVERTLAQLAALTGHTLDFGQSADTSTPTQGFGPAIPGLTSDAVSEQNDVDALLADLGM
jgi:chemotaxis protein CheZ